MKVESNRANKNTLRANFLLRVNYFFSQKIRKTGKFLRLEGGRHFLLCYYADIVLFYPFYRNSRSKAPWEDYFYPQILITCGSLLNIFSNLAPKLVNAKALLYNQIFLEC